MAQQYVSFQLYEAKGGEEIKQIFIITSKKTSNLYPLDCLLANPLNYYEEIENE